MTRWRRLHLATSSNMPYTVWAEEEARENARTGRTYYAITQHVLFDGQRYYTGGEVYLVDRTCLLACAIDLAEFRKALAMAAAQAL